MRLAVFEGYGLPSNLRGSSRRRATGGKASTHKEHNMARRRRRRGFGDFLTVPGLGNIAKDINPIGKSVRVNDLLLGVAVGAAGGAAVKMGINKAGIAAKLPAFISNNIGPVSTLLAGAAGYMFYKKKNAAKAQGILYGAMIAGLVPLGWNTLQARFPTYFADYQTVPGLGTIVQQPLGMIVEESSPGLQGLAAISDTDEAF
jgi:hypothetical protein